MVQRIIHEPKNSESYHVHGEELYWSENAGSRYVSNLPVPTDTAETMDQIQMPAELVPQSASWR